jgi:hypothetical protein
MNRRDAMSAEKTAGEKILLEMRDSALLHCDGRRENNDEWESPPGARPFGW